ncbi:twin-arginine translocase TatA/TatE family subunit [Halobacteriovorax sp. GB3]|uniref:twin-arginine translocase TatA/TatE family subunit n=1 Tax=Halobacteriovorax sp. GB3 TaxID=2719615 RepID=UPI00235DC704|nr:twin-arginine translocase TatA/TatE family subunit [Halobacteriovorax sp. GB3]MDD0852757.1 twin-arginine translocase TatA/TatE family subunit [Halobacteriovorax sp. GB3]
MFGIGMFELLIIFVFALVFIGPKKLPELAKGLGKGLREFQKAKDDLMNHVNDTTPQSQPEQQTVKIHDEEAVETSAVQKENLANEKPSEEVRQKNDAGEV